MEKKLKTKVLIVGAGPVGLALALELATQGISSIVVERNERVGLAPRAKTVNVRTRELFRRWGIADRLAAESPFGVDYPSDVVFATRLAGKELVRFSNAFYCRPGQDARFSEHAQWIPQYKVEKVLRDRLQELAEVEIHFGTELISFEQNDACVLATLKQNMDGAAQREISIEADFIVGADGARSTVRRALGIDMEGVSPLSHHNNIVFRSRALKGAHRLGKAAMYWLINSDAPATLSAMDSDGRWAYGCTTLPENDDASIALIRRSLGFDSAVDAGIDIEILSNDEWTAHRLIAKNYGRGRAFLVGDASHLHPPYGGYGMNMGIGDAVDLGWKLGAVLKGWSARSLLDSYEVERRQIHERTIKEAVTNHASTASKLVEPGIEEEGAERDAIRERVAGKIWNAKRREFDSLGVVLGSRYRYSNTLPAEASEGDDDDALNYRPLARAGCLAPHVWLRAGTEIGHSLYDHFSSRGFTLLVLDSSAEEDAHVFAEAAGALGIPLEVFRLDAADVRSLYKCRFALIRPDQYIAWCGEDVKDAEGILKIATGWQAEVAKRETVAN